MVDAGAGANFRIVSVDEFALGELSATSSGGSALPLTQPDGTTAGFDTDVLTYTATAPAGATTVTVDATAATAVATIASVQYAVGDPLTATFTDSGTLTVVADEDNIITVRVANEDDTTTRDYTITLTVPAPPLITSDSPTVTRVSSTSGAYNFGKNIIIDVRFSEPVTVTGRPQLALIGGRIASFRRVVRDTNVRFAYPVAANDNVAMLAYTGTYALTLPDGATIKNAAATLDADPTLPTPGDPNSLSGSSNVVIDTTPPAVESVTYYASEADATAATTPIAEAAIGATIYARVQFSENMQNRNTSASSPGLPIISVFHQTLPVGTLTDPYSIIAHDAEFQTNEEQCRADSATDPATDTSRYLCQIFLESFSYNVGTAHVRVSMTTNGGATQDLAGNQLEMDYTTDTNTGFSVRLPAVPSVTSVTHYPTAALAAALTYTVSGDIYSLIQFNSSGINTKSGMGDAARPEIFYQIDTDDRVQFHYQSNGIPDPGACRLYSGNQQFWCRYATEPGNTGPYKIIVGTNTQDFYGQPLAADYPSAPVTLAVVAGDAAALTMDVMDDATVDEGAGTYEVTVTLDTAVTGGFLVDASTADGIAVAPDDYIALTAHTLTFAGTANETQTFSVTIIDDEITENIMGEVLTLRLRNVRDTTTPIAVDTATLTITDNDKSTVTIIRDISVGEGDGTAAVQVRLGKATYTSFTVLAATTMDGSATATAGQDYTEASQTLQFTGTAAGEILTFSVPITDDNIAEPDETLTVSVGSPIFGRIDGEFTPGHTTTTNLIAANTATITIVDNDKLTFDGAIPDQDWVVGTAVNLTLPAATGGNGMPRYTLAGNLPDGITAANNANAAAPTTLTGTPMAATASATALTYTVTDSDPTNPVLPIALTFSATVRAAGDATLTALSVTPFQRPRLTLDPPFAAGITTYTAAVPLLNTTDVTVRVTFSDNDATLQCATGATPADDDFNPAVSDGVCPLTIAAGDTVLTARVTAADDITIRDYTITVTLDTLDDTPPTVESVTYYADEAATTTFTEARAAIGAVVYAAIQFNENMDNTVSVGNSVPGRPVIYASYDGGSIGRREASFLIIPHGTGFLDDAAQCRAASATDTSSYLCQVALLPSVFAAGAVRMGVRTQGLLAPTPPILRAVTQDLAGNRLAADYLDPTGITAFQQDPPIVASVTHYPTAARTTAIEDTDTLVSGDIYTVIQFTGASIERNVADTSAARPEIFHEIDTADRAQFHYVSGIGTPAAGTCRPLTIAVVRQANDPQFWCRYATQPGNTGQYKIIVGIGTLDIYGNALAAEYNGDSGVTLDVVNGTATLTIEEGVSVTEGGTASISVTLDTAVTGGFTVDVSTADGTAVAAVAPGDYTALTAHTLTFAGTAGEVQTFSVVTTDDDIAESGQGETLTLALGTPQDTDTPITIGTATLTINDNDTSTVTIAIADDDGRVSEGAGTVVVTVMLDNDFYTGFELRTNTVGGTATGNQDFTILSGHRLEFDGTAGETQTFSVTITDDTIVEPEETLTVNMDSLFLDPIDGISTVGASAIANLDIDNTAIITIVDNELALVATIPDQTWVVGVPVALTLPEATGGNDEPRYTLTGTLPDGITAANNANADAPTTLSGMPTAAATATTATLTYTVTDSDQTAPVTSIALTFSAAVRAAGTDATLNALSVMLSDDTDLPLTPAFAAATTAYAVTAPSATTTVTVAADANDANATVAIAGTAANGSTALGVTGGAVSGLTAGDNVITVTVTAEDRSTQDYTITLTVLSADATLSALSVMPSGGMALTLTHSDGTTTDFATGQFTYTARAPAGTTTVTVTADTTDDGADVDIAVTDADGTPLTVDPATGEVSGLTTGDNTITVTVTAEDRSIIQDYTITLTVLGPIVLTGLPFGSETHLFYGGIEAGSRYPFTADPSDTVLAVSSNGVFTARIFADPSGIAGEWILGVTPPASGDIFEDIVTITATDPDGVLPELTHDIRFTVRAPAIKLAFTGVNASDLDTSAPLDLDDVFNFEVQVDLAAATVNLVSTNGLFTLLLDDVSPAGAMGSGSIYKYGALAPDEPADIPPGIVASGGLYTDTIVATASAPGRNTVRRTITLSLRQEVGLTNLNILDTSFDDFGDAPRTFTFNVDPPNTAVTFIHNSVFTIDETDTTGDTRAFTVAPPATAPPNDARIDTITVMVSDPDDVRQPLSRSFTFTIGERVVVTGLPAGGADNVLLFDGPAQTFDFSVEPTDATVAATLTLFSPGTVSVAPKVGGAAGEWTLSVTPPALSPSGAATGVGVNISVTATGRVPFTSIIKFPVMPVVVIGELPSGADTVLEYGAAASTFELTLEPSSARETGTVTATSTGIVDVEILDSGSYDFDGTGNSGRWTLRVTPPSTGTTYTDTVTITATADGHTTFMQDITFTIVDATLSVLSVTPSGGMALTLTQSDGTITGFATAELTYTATTPVGTTTVAVTATTNDGAATYTITGTDAGGTDLGVTSTTTGGDVTGLTAGDNTVTVTVTAADGSTMRDYTITLTVPGPIVLTGLPSGTTMLVYGDPGTSFPFTVEPTDAVLTSTSNGVFGHNIDSISTAPAGEWILDVFPPGTGVTYTDTIRITATDPSGVRSEITQDIEFSVAPPTTLTIEANRGGTTAPPDTTTVFNFAESRQVTFHVRPLDATLTVVSDNNLFRPTADSRAQTLIGNLFTIAAPTSVRSVPPGVTATGGLYTGTVTATATRPGITGSATVTLTYTLNQEVVLTGPDVPDTSFDGFGAAVRTYAFTVEPITADVTIDPAPSTVFDTWSLTDNGSGNWMFTIAPPATDPGDSTYFDTLTITATDSIGSRQTSTREITFTIGEPVGLTGFPATVAERTLEYGGAPAIFTLTAEPVGAIVTWATGLPSLPGTVDPGTVEIVQLDSNQGTWTMTVTPLATPPANGNGDIIVGTVMATADGRAPFTLPLLDFPILPAVVISGLPTSATLDFGATASTFDFTLRPDNVRSTVTVTATSNGVVTAEVTNNGGGNYRLSVTPPNTGTTYTDMVTITATADGHTTFMQDIPFTIVDATLSALTVTPSGGAILTFTPAFDAAELTYTATVPAGTTTVTVDATANDTGATGVAIAGTDADGTALTVDPVTGDVSGLTTGDNTITVTVTAADGTTMRAYTITLTVLQSADATLRALSIFLPEPQGSAAEPLPLTPAFAAETTAYAVVFPTGTRAIRVLADATSSVASVQYALSDNPTTGDFKSSTEESGVVSYSNSFTGTSLLRNRLTVRVTAEDRTTQDHIITLSIRATAFTDATLSGLTVTTSDDTAVTLAPTFDAGTFAYTATAPSGTTSVTVAATVNDLVGASVQYAVGDSPADADFVDSGTLTVDTGDNTLTARVTAEDDSTQDYTITLTVQAAPVTTDPQQTQDVPSHWALIPDPDKDGLDFGPGQSFRLLFMTEDGSKAESPDIAVYNAFVQNSASGAEDAGEPIAEFSAKFRALISTPTVDARDNTGTNNDTGSDADAPIYWLNGARVADNYTDFYNENWKREGSESPKNRLRE